MSSGATRATYHAWHLIDGQNQHIGRLASQIAKVIQGKHKPTFSPHLDHGDHVVVINAQDMVFTGKKFTDKKYRWHSGYIGGLKTRNPKHFAENQDRPEVLLEKAVSGMLPKNGLRSTRLNRLMVYKGVENPHMNKFDEFSPYFTKAMQRTEPKKKKTFEVVYPHQGE